MKVSFKFKLAGILQGHLVSAKSLLARGFDLQSTDVLCMCIMKP